MGRTKRSGAGEQGLDMTPMIDVVFQLIIFFVVTANLNQQAVNKDIQLPIAPHGISEKTRDPRQITIQVGENGQYYIGSKRYSLNDLRNVMRATVRTNPKIQIPVLIRGDSDALHRYVRKAMDACAEVGIAQVRIAGLKSASKVPRPAH